MPELREYIVTEVVQYKVMAESARHAEEIITESEDRDKYCFAVTERDAERADGEPEDDTADDDVSAEEDAEDYRRLIESLAAQKAANANKGT